MSILYFDIFQRDFEVLNAIVQSPVYLTIVTAMVYYNMYRYQNFFFCILLVV